MARLRVGDIVIDGSRVSIGDERPPDIEAGRTSLSPLSTGKGGTEFVDAFRAVPVPSRWLLAGSGVFLVIGAVSFLITSGPIDPVGYLVRGVAAAAAGAALGVFGLLKRLVERHDGERLKREADARILPIAERIRAIIPEPRSEQTVEWLARACEAPPDAVVRALGLLRARGEVIEDFDAPSGQWFYWAAPVGRSLDARLGTLDRSGER